MKDYIITPCGKFSTELFKEKYEAMSDQEICDLVNGRFVDPFALSEMEQRPNISLVNGRKEEVKK